MAKIRQFQRTYEDILRSFIIYINERGNEEYDYNLMNDAEKQQLLVILTTETKKATVRGLELFTIHVLGYNFKWYHTRWTQALFKHKFLAVEANRSRGKSFFFNHIIPMWVNWAQPTFPSKFGTGSSYDTMSIAINGDMVKNFIKKSRAQYETNEFLANLVDTSASADWTKTELSFKNDARLIGRSFGSSSIRGNHLSGVVTLDDLLSEESEISPMEMRNKLDNVVISITTRHGAKLIIVGTSFSEDDIYRYFLFLTQEEENQENALYGYVRTSIELDHTEKKVYAIFYNAYTNTIEKFEDDEYDYDLLASHQKRNPISFSREWQCKIVSDSDVPFPMPDLKACCSTEISYDDIKPRDDKNHYSGLDFASSEKKDADSLVHLIGRDIKVILTDEEGVETQKSKTLICSIYEDNHSPMPTRTSRVISRLKKWNALCLAEKNNMGDTIIQDWKYTKGVNVTPFTTSRDSKISLVEFCSLIVKNHDIVFPYKKLKDQKITDSLIAQLTGYQEKRTRTGLKTYDGTTKHDDLVIGFMLMLKNKFDNEKDVFTISGFSREKMKDEEFGKPNGKPNGKSNIEHLKTLVTNKNAFFF